MDNIKVDYTRNSLKRHSTLSVIFKFVSMGLSFISAPLMLKCLGQEKYGVWASLLSVVSWIYYFDIGIGGGLQIKLATALAKEENERANKLIGAAYLSLSFIATVAFLVGAIAFHLVDISTFFHYETINENVSEIMIIALLFACINFVLQLVNNIFYALQKVSYVSLFSLLSQVIMIVCLLFYIKYGIKLLLVVAITDGASNLIKNLIASIYCYKKYPQLNNAFHDIRLEYTKDIMSFGVQMFVISIASLVLNTTDNLLISKYFGSGEVTPYSFCYKFFSTIQAVYVAVITPYSTAYSAALAQKNLNWLYKTFKTIIKIWLIFIILCVLGIIIFEPFSGIWLGQNLNYQNGLIPLTAFYFIILMLGHIGTGYINATYQTKKIIIPTLIEAIINIPLSIVFAVNMGMGINGIILGSIVSLLIEAICAIVITINSLKNLH